MARTYYSMIEIDTAGEASVQFGDYSRLVVVDEIADRKDSGDFVKGTKFKIVAHPDSITDWRAILVYGGFIVAMDLENPADLHGTLKDLLGE